MFQNFRLTPNKSITLVLFRDSADAVRVGRIDRVQGVEKDMFADLVGEIIPFQQLKKEVFRRLGVLSEIKATPMTYRGVVIFPDNSRVKADESCASPEEAFRRALAHAPVPLTRGCVVGILVE
jgi:hypothetical protein